VVDLGRVGVATQDDHLSLRVVDVRDAVEDQLDVVNIGLDDVLHVQVGLIEQPSVFWPLSNVLNFIDTGNMHHMSIVSALLVIDDLCSCKWRPCSGLSSTNI
jgi:hypothetical protein